MLRQLCPPSLRTVGEMRHQSECPRPEKPKLEIYGSSFQYDPDIEQITPVYHVRAGKFRAEAVDISLSAQFGDIIKDEEYAQELRRSHMQGGATVNMIVQSWHSTVESRQVCVNLQS